VSIEHTHTRTQTHARTHARTRAHTHTHLEVIDNKLAHRLVCHDVENPIATDDEEVVVDRALNDSHVRGARDLRALAHAECKMDGR
jgi:hypothetical protein